MAECLGVDACGEGEEVLAAANNGSKEDTLFDQTVGHLQDILLEEAFIETLTDFMEKHYQHFEDTDENKFIYTDIFKEFSEIVEHHLECELKTRLPAFGMENFLKSIQSREGEVGEEIMDTLLAFTDFIAFKRMMLDYKAFALEREGCGLELGGLTVTSLSAMER